MNYKIRIINSDGNTDKQVNLLKEIAENTYSVEWTFTLKDDDEPIVLSETFNEDCFIVANWNAWVRIYSISKKALIFEKKYKAEGLSKVIISDDKTKLYIAYNTRDSETFIEIISLIDFSIIKTIELPKRFCFEHFTLGTDNQLMFYYAESVLEDTYSHGYNIVNENTGKIEHFPMEYPQLKNFRIAPPVISPKSNLGILPFWNNIEVEKDVNNNPLFIFKVMLFNLTNYKVEKIISVRAFTTQQLQGNRITSSEEYATIFQSEDKKSEKYKKAVKDFIENLHSVFFEEASDSFWLCFRGAIMRKITFDGKLSPLFVTTAISSSTGQEKFNPRHFDSYGYIIATHQNALTLREYNGDYTMTFSRDELSSGEALIEKELAKKEKDSIKIITPKKTNS